jgi:hypothetical protein
MVNKHDKPEWQLILNQLKLKYNINDSGNAELILGMRISRDRVTGTITLDQEIYINKLLKQFNLHDCNVAVTPTSTYVLSSNDCPTEEQIKLDNDYSNFRQLYQQMVGSLNYASICTRPDITYAVNVLSRYLHNPGQQHMIACKRVFRYLKGTSKLGLILGGGNNKMTNNNNFPLIGYSDSDWASDRDNRRSTSGYVIQFCDSTISWCSRRQSTIALSTCEAEYYAVSNMVTELIWIKQFMMELFSYDNELRKSEIPLIGLVDNQSALAISNNDTNHSRSKHIDIRHHFIRSMIKSNELKLKYVSTVNQLADIFTKGLGKIIFNRLRNTIMEVKQLIEEQ